MEQPNLDYFEKLSNQNANFKQRLIDVLKYELPLEIADYQNHIKKNDLKKAAEAVHKLKHKIGVLGMEKGYLEVEQYENNLREGSKSLQLEFEQTIKIIEQFVKLL